MSNDILTEIYQVLEQRRHADSNNSYTASLFEKGHDSILKKVGEEASEVLIASKSGEKDDIIHEIADLWFHTLVLLKHHDYELGDVMQELENRFGTSGLEEKANRSK
ncbi:MAG: phosphoribosyl-ATP diphosphatase [Pseudomonadota bacterium]